MTDFDKLKSQVEMTVTAEGLRIELMEAASGTFFDSGSSKLNQDGSELLGKLAEEQLPTLRKHLRMAEQIQSGI